MIFRRTSDGNRFADHSRALLIIGVVFAISVFVRWPMMDRPLSHGYEWLTAHTLVVHKVWDLKGGMVKNYFAQNMSFAGEHNRFINNAAQSEDYESYPIGPNGDYYYLSHPPLGVIAPYVVLKTLRLPSTPLNIQCFNLALQLICALLLYATFCALVPRGSDARAAAVLGAACYIWLPSNLWFHSNVYYVEIFVQLPFLLSAYLFALYTRAKHEGEPANWLLWGLGLAVFATAFSEWLGVLTGAALFAWALFRPTADRDWPLATTSAIATASALGLFVIQHAQIVGLEEFVQHMYRQFLFRAHPGENAPSFAQEGLDRIIDNYRLGIRPSVFLFAALAGALAAVKRDWRSLSPTLPVLYLLAVPTLAHHAILAGFTSQHWYSMLKVTPLLCFVLAAMLFYVLRDKLQPAWFVSGFTVFVAGLGYFSYTEYQRNYIEWLGDPNHYNVLSHNINVNSEPDDVVFLVQDSTVSPQFLHYTQRNIKAVESVEAAKEWFARQNGRVTKGVVFRNVGAPDFERIGR